MLSKTLSLRLLRLAIVPFFYPYLTQAQQAADGTIVPFKSGLPPCASQCGPLYDVQGACAQPNVTPASQSCFCGDSRLTPFTANSGTQGVSNVCGPTSCTAASDLQAIRDWYQNYCKGGSTSGQGTATSAAPGATGTSSGSSKSGSSNNGQGQTWIAAHYKWVIMIAVIVFGLIGIWVGACIWRRRYIRKKERAFELRPPVVAWGPHQAQAGYGDGTVDSSRGGARPVEKAPPATRGVYTPSPLGNAASSSDSPSDGGHYKEASAQAQDYPLATPADGTGATQQSGKKWLRKSRP